MNKKASHMQSSGGSGNGQAGLSNAIGLGDTRAVLKYGLRKQFLSRIDTAYNATDECKDLLPYDHTNISCVCRC